MDALLKACDDACGNTRCNPPGMEMIFEDGVEEDQLDAAKAAVAAGVRPQDVYAAIAECVEQVDEGYPDSILSFLVSKGLSGSSKLPGGGYLLHDLLSQEYPPPCKPAAADQAAAPAAGEAGPSDAQAAAARGRQRDQVYLNDLLVGIKPTKKQGGYTALHILVRNCINKVYYRDAESATECLAIFFAGGRDSDMHYDDSRAEYLAEAFPLMIAAGFDPEARDSQGRSVIDYMQTGYKSYAQSAFRLGDFKGAKARQMAATLKQCIEQCGQEVPADAEPRHHAPAAARAPPDALRARMPFGKHRGKLLSELPANYIAWMCRENVLEGKNDLARHMVDLGLVKQTQRGWLPLVGLPTYDDDDFWY